MHSIRWRKRSHTSTTEVINGRGKEWGTRESESRVSINKQAISHVSIRRSRVNDSKTQGILNRKQGVRAASTAESATVLSKDSIRSQDQMTMQTTGQYELFTLQVHGRTSTIKKSNASTNIWWAFPKTKAYVER
jgi:hypothetical protein